MRACVIQFDRIQQEQYPCQLELIDIEFGANNDYFDEQISRSKVK